MSEPKKNSESLSKSITGAMSMFTSSNSGVKSEKSPEDIPREELVHLCMKMNKRMQAMEAKGQELIKKKNSLANDRKIMLSFLTSIPLPLSIRDDDDISEEELYHMWQNFKSKQDEYISTLEAKVSTLQQGLSNNEQSSSDHTEISKSQVSKHDDQILFQHTQFREVT